MFSGFGLHGIPSVDPGPTKVESSPEKAASTSDTPTTGNTSKAKPVSPHVTDEADPTELSNPLANEPQASSSTVRALHEANKGSDAVLQPEKDATSSTVSGGIGVGDQSGLTTVSSSDTLDVKSAGNADTMGAEGLGMVGGETDDLRDLFEQVYGKDSSGSRNRLTSSTGDEGAGGGGGADDKEEELGNIVAEAPNAGADGKPRLPGKKGTYGSHVNKPGSGADSKVAGAYGDHNIRSGASATAYASGTGADASKGAIGVSKYGSSTGGKTPLVSQAEAPEPPPEPYPEYSLEYPHCTSLKHLLPRFESKCWSDPGGSCPRTLRVADRDIVVLMLADHDNIRDATLGLPSRYHIAPDPWVVGIDPRRREILCYAVEIDQNSKEARLHRFKDDRRFKNALAATSVRRPEINKPKADADPKEPGPFSAQESRSNAGRASPSVESALNDAGYAGGEGRFAGDNTARNAAVGIYNSAPSVPDTAGNNEAAASPTTTGNKTDGNSQLTGIIGSGIVLFSALVVFTIFLVRRKRRQRAAPQRPPDRGR